MQQQFNQINTELQSYLEEDYDKPVSNLIEINELISQTMLDVDLSDCTSSLIC